jgi:hypothetical protein
VGKYLHAGAAGPDVSVLWWTTPKGAGITFTSLLPGVCRRCRRVVRAYAGRWWDDDRTVHTDCDRVRLDAAVPPVRRVTTEQRVRERRELMRRHHLTEDQWDALPSTTRRRLTAQLRSERWGSEYADRLARIVKDGDDAGA